LTIEPNIAIINGFQILERSENLAFRQALARGALGLSNDCKH